MNNIEVHMKDDNRIGDKVKILIYEHGAYVDEIVRIEILETDGSIGYKYHISRLILYASNGCFRNLSAIGRKAALASKNKVSRDSKGRFVKIPRGDAGGEVKFTVTLNPTLESLEKRIEDLEKRGFCNCLNVPNTKGNGTC